MKKIMNVEKWYEKYGQWDDAEADLIYFYDSDAERLDYNIVEDYLEAQEWVDNYDIIEDEDTFMVKINDETDFNYRITIDTELNYGELLDNFKDAVKTLDYGYTPEQWEHGQYVYLKRFENAEKLKYTIIDKIDHDDFDGWKDLVDWDDIYERLNDYAENFEEKYGRKMTEEEYQDEAELMAWDDVEVQCEEVWRRLEVEEHKHSSWECSFDRDNPYEVEEWFEQQFKELEEDDE